MGKRRKKTAIETVVEAIIRELVALEGFAKAISSDPKRVQAYFDLREVETLMYKRTAEIRRQLKRLEEV